MIARLAKAPAIAAVDVRSTGSENNNVISNATTKRSEDGQSGSRDWTTRDVIVAPTPTSADCDSSGGSSEMTTYHSQAAGACDVITYTICVISNDCWQRGGVQITPQLRVVEGDVNPRSSVACSDVNRERLRLCIHCNLIGLQSGSCCSNSSFVDFTQH